MKKLVLNILVRFVLVLGILETLLGLLMLLPAIPSLIQIVSGTTSLALVSEENGMITASLVLNAGAFAFLTSGFLFLAQGVIGLRALKTQDYFKLIFLSGAVLFSSVFELMLGLSDSGSIYTWLDFALQLSLIVFAELQQRAVSA